MKDFQVLRFSNTNENNEILIAVLNELNFDSFEEINNNELEAYILSKDFDENQLKMYLSSFSILSGIEYKARPLENKNWNEVWEQSFKAIEIKDLCHVRAPFHPASGAKYELVIEPKMAFGTGHHATTKMVLELMLTMDFEQKEVLDFGCGTGILSLLAEKLGAKHIDANDIEEPAYQNTIENSLLNNCSKIEAYHGDFSVLPKKMYDIVLANVTTNTIQENLELLIQLMNNDAQILLSGILHEQQEIVKELAQRMNLTFQHQLEENNWVALQYLKK